MLAAGGHARPRAVLPDRGRSAIRFLGAWVAAMAMLPAAALPATAQEALRGTWRGGYVCSQGHTALALTIEPRKDGTLAALFHFEAASDNPGVPTGCFEMDGRLDAATGRLSFRPLRWVVRPAGYVMVGLEGSLSPDTARLEGQVAGPGCTAFRVEREPGPAAGQACRAGAPLLSLR